MRLAFAIFLLILTRSAYSRSIKGGNIIDPISNGPVDRILELPSNGSLRSTTVTCTPIYGFLPCAADLWGELFLVVVYEYLLYVAWQYITSGANLLFQMFGPGIFGATLFQLLGVVPQIVILLVPGITSSKDTMQSMAPMGMGMLAGSAVFILTSVWSSIIAFGVQDPTEDTTSNSTSSTQKRRNYFSFLGYSVETDGDTKYIARLMFASVIPLFTLQLLKIITSSTGQRIIILISIIISVVLFLVYCIYEVFQPWIQNKRFEYMIGMSAKASVIRDMVIVNGKPNESRMKELFETIDKNGYTSVSEDELFAFILGIQMEEVGIQSCLDVTSRLMEAFDTTPDKMVTEEEFVKGLSKWIKQGTSTATNSNGVYNNAKLFLPESTEEYRGLLSRYETATTTSKSKPSGPAWRNYTKAGFLILFGTGVMAALGKPLMNSFQEFASFVGVAPSIASYVFVPYATCYSQARGSISLAKKKNTKDISLALTEVYVAVFLNNVVGLTAFLLLVYIRGISLDVAAEVQVVLIICTVLGCIASFLTKFPFWISIIAYALGPIALSLLCVFISGLGWQ